MALQTSCLGLFTAASALIILSACSPSNSSGDSQSSSRLTLLSVNLRGINDVPCNDGVTWKTRYDRIGRDLRAGGVVPDVIALQEVTAWMWCTFDHKFSRDYTALDKLLHHSRAAPACSTGLRT